MLKCLNFVLLQLFFVRLARVTEWQTVRTPGQAHLFPRNYVQREVTVGYKLLRWIWPLTGWWSPLRYVRTVDPFGMKRMPRDQLKLWMRDIGLQPKRWETYGSMRKRTQAFMRRA